MIGTSQAGRGASLPPGAGGGADAPGARCRAGSSETAPGTRAERAEAQPTPGERPPEEGAEPQARGPVLGGFTRRKAPKVSCPGEAVRRSWGAGKVVRA